MNQPLNKDTRDNLIKTIELIEKRKPSEELLKEIEMCSLYVNKAHAQGILSEEESGQYQKRLSDLMYSSITSLAPNGLQMLKQGTMMMTGTPADIATQLNEQFIKPMVIKMAGNNPQDGLQFLFAMFGETLGNLANICDDLAVFDEVDKGIREVLDETRKAITEMLASPTTQPAQQLDEINDDEPPFAPDAATATQAGLEAGFVCGTPSIGHQTS